MQIYFLLIMAAYILGNVYIFIRSLQTLAGLPTPWRILFGILYWVVALGFFFAMMARNIDIPEALSRTLFRVGSSWMVFILYMVLILGVCDIVRLLLPAFKFGFPLALVLTVVLLVYGHLNYIHPNVEEVDIAIDKPLDGEVKIVAISDVHLGEGTGKRQLQRYVEKINALKPDVIVIAGDLIDNSLHPLYRDRMDEELRQLQAPMGVYMALGNHEYISGADESEQFIAQTPIRLLRDEVVTLPNGIQIVGRDDRSNRSRLTLNKLLEQTSAEKPIIVLDHQPYNLSRVEGTAVDLQFSGHTHRGQVWPLSLVTDRMYEQSYGYRLWGNTHIYVSSGLSLWGPPFRIGTESELVLFTIKSK